MHSRFPKCRGSTKITWLWRTWWHCLLTFIVFFTSYTTYRPILYHYPSTQLITVLYYWCLRSYTPFCFMWAIDVLCFHTTLQRLLFVFSNCAIILCMLLYVSFILNRAWTVCSHLMLSRTFYVTFIPLTVCECHIELKATWLVCYRKRSSLKRVHPFHILQLESFVSNKVSAWSAAADFAVHFVRFSLKIFNNNHCWFYYAHTCELCAYRRSRKQLW